MNTSYRISIPFWWWGFRGSWPSWRWPTWWWWPPWHVWWWWELPCTLTTAHPKLGPHRLLDHSVHHVAILLLDTEKEIQMKHSTNNDFSSTYNLGLLFDSISMSCVSQDTFCSQTSHCQVWHVKKLLALFKYKKNTKVEQIIHNLHLLKYGPCAAGREFSSIIVHNLTSVRILVRPKYTSNHISEWIPVQYSDIFSQITFF